MIRQLEQENKEKATAINNSRGAMQDVRLAMSMWKEKVDEKKRLLEDSKEALRVRDAQIAHLKELLSQSGDERAVLQFRVALKAKEKELAESREQSRQVTKKLEEENRAVKVSNLELVRSVQESSKYISDLKERLRALESADSKAKSDISISGKENQWHAQASKWKAEADKLRRDVARLEAERARLGGENDSLLAHCNANQKIHLYQKMKDENNALRAQNYKLSEGIKEVRERAARAEKDAQYLQAKLKLGAADNQPIPSEYEKRIAQLEERVRREAAISDELSKLPEVLPIYGEESLEGAEPLELIARATDYLVQTVRV